MEKNWLTTKDDEYPIIYYGFQKHPRWLLGISSFNSMFVSGRKHPDVLKKHPSFAEKKHMKIPQGIHPRRPPDIHKNLPEC